MTNATASCLVRRFYDEIWNVPDLAAIPGIVHPAFSFRGSLGTPAHGHAEFAAYVSMVTSALSDYHCAIEHLVADDENAAARMLFSGRHTGDFRGHPPTGRPVSWAGAAFFRLEDGLIRDLWVLGDLISLDRELSTPGVTIRSC